MQASGPRFLELPHSFAYDRRIAVSIIAVHKQRYSNRPRDFVGALDHIAPRKLAAIPQPQRSAHGETGKRGRNEARLLYQLRAEDVVATWNDYPAPCFQQGAQRSGLCAHRVAPGVAIMIGRGLRTARSISDQPVTGCGDTLQGFLKLLHARRIGQPEERRHVKGRTRHKGDKRLTQDIAYEIAV